MLKNLLQTFKMDSLVKKSFFLLAFIEGGAVMCVELCSAKILTPFFGTSIYVWAAVLGITLTSLMSGYYLGGYISAKNQQKNTIYWLMLIGGLLVTLTPIISDIVLPITINLSLTIGSIISLISFLFFPLMLFGATSPLLINYLTNDAKASGKSSGTVYAISTFGGIITTFAVGFYTLPEFGITNTLYGYGLLIMVYSTFLFIVTKKFKIPVAVVLLVGILSLNFQNRFNENTLYYSEGILGEVKVIERTYQLDNQPKVYRELLVNNICQTMMDKNNPNKSYWDYVDILTNNINHYKNGNQVLLLGLGGGTLYKKLKENNLSVDVVEIDERIAQVSKEFFFIDDDLNIIVDDARHYINTTNKKYDIIIYDLFHAETPPTHLMTSEAFAEIKDKLNSNGLLIVNFYGYINNEKGEAARSIFKTLETNNYYTHIIATPGAENARNLLFINGKTELKKSLANSIVIAPENINFNNALVLSDDKPALEHIYLQAALDWRKNYNEMNAKQFLKN
jgi:predicted membrane-bound spermidine synthase